ncbi:HlyD family secretion protein [Undibacterium sp. TJN25]|uniref:HlyD family secretion protein n=1 Tax=Undibacterium sp. TJN25 TaxID=3413056 RepID=UPI003BEF97A3
MTSFSEMNARLKPWITLPILLGVLLVLYAWHLPPFSSAIETTENAYVRGSVTLIAPKVDGYVTEVLVQDFNSVTAGQVLVKLDDRNYRAKLEQARSILAVQETALTNFPQTLRVREANVQVGEAQIASTRAQLSNARAQLAKATADMRRVDALMKEDSLSQREHDLTQAALQQAEAGAKQAEAVVRQADANSISSKQELTSVKVNRSALEASVANAKASVRLAEIDLENTSIRAPRSGQVGEVGVKLGQYVVPGTQLMPLVPSTVWVVANFKEAQTARMEPGQPVSFTVDGLADAKLKGTIERISPATGSEFSAIRPDNATGNFTKIPQRLLVRISIDPSDPLSARLRPGMSVVASVDTAKSSTKSPSGTAKQ